MKKNRTYTSLPLAAMLLYGLASSASAVDPNLIRDSPIVVAAIVDHVDGPDAVELLEQKQVPEDCKVAYRVMLRIDDCFKGDVPSEITVAVPAHTIHEMIFGTGKRTLITFPPTAKDEEERIDSTRLKSLSGTEWLWYLQFRTPMGSFLQTSGIAFAKGFPPRPLPRPQWDVKGTDYAVYPLLSSRPEQLGRWDHDRTLPPYLRLLDLVVVNLCDSRKYQYWQDLGMLCPAMEAPNLSDYGPGALINLVPRAEQETWFAKAAKRLPSETDRQAMDVAALRVLWGDDAAQSECFRLMKKVGYEKLDVPTPMFKDRAVYLWIAQNAPSEYAVVGFRGLHGVDRSLMRSTAKIALKRLGEHPSLNAEILDWASWALDRKDLSSQDEHGLRADLYQAGEKARGVLKKLTE